jgi:endogenous inhibitor of DNA gyrase (YacG/DUF329 family)
MTARRRSKYNPWPPLFDRLQVCNDSIHQPLGGGRPAKSVRIYRELGGNMDCPTCGRKTTWTGDAIPADACRCVPPKPKLSLEVTAPCPFCGMPPRVEDGEHEKNLVTVQTDDGWVVRCIVGCCAQGPMSDTEEQAVAEWNTQKGQSCE